MYVFLRSFNTPQRKRTNGGQYETTTSIETSMQSLRGSRKGHTIGYNSPGEAWGVLKYAAIFLFNKGYAYVRTDLGMIVVGQTIGLLCRHVMV